MRVVSTKLDGVVVLEPQVFDDDRGFFLESYNRREFLEAGIVEEFVQVNHSRSCKDVLRGLHGQKRYPQGKLVRVSRGAIFDVAVDINPRSSTYRQWIAYELSDSNFRQLYVPPGYLHGFCVMSDIADVQYMCTEFYRPDDEIGVIWNDTEIGIDWPSNSPIVSTKDQNLPTLSEL